MNDKIKGMVDISDKVLSHRTAVASGRIFLRSVTIAAIKQGQIRKGDVLEASRLAALSAVKKTPTLLPFCHQVPLDTVLVDWDIAGDHISVQVSVKVTAKTGVEMEALVGVSTALLNVWDMVKYLEKDEAGQYPESRINEIRVVEKSKTPLVS